MKRNLKGLGLCLVAVLAVGAVLAQGAWAAVEHEFHADGEKSVITGHGEFHEITIGSRGVVKCKTVEGETTSVGTKVGENTYATDQITAIPHYKECEFGGQPATVNMHHCSVVLDSDTTEGNTTLNGEHANVEIECEGTENKITVLTNACTLTIAPQVVKHAVRFENDPENKNAIKVIVTAHEIAMSNLNDKAGCALFPKGKIGKYVGTATATCYRDDGTSTLTGTEKTTPTEKTVEGPETECKVSNL